MAGYNSESQHVDLLISLLLHFPQIGSLHYNPDENKLKLLFLFRDVQNEQLMALQAHYKNHLDTLKVIMCQEFTCCNIVICNYPDLNSLSIERDLLSFSYEELVITIELITEAFQKEIVMEDAQESHTEYGSSTDLYQLLESARYEQGHTILVGFRTKGRVLVYRDTVEQKINVSNS